MAIELNSFRKMAIMAMRHERLHQCTTTNISEGKGKDHLPRFKQQITRNYLVGLSLERPILEATKTS